MLDLAAFGAWLVSPATVSYIVVMGIGAVVGLAEIVSTFPHSPAEAFKNRWGQLLIALNVVSAAIVLWIVNRYAPAGSDSLGTAIAVGVGFPTVVRTKFTIAKQFAGEEGRDLSINVGWLYDQFQNLCKTQIDLALVMTRQRLIKALMDKYATVPELAEIAHTVMQERALFTQEDVEKLQKYVEGVVASATMSDVAKRVTLARFILDTGGPGYVQAITKPEKRGANRNE